jgi:hypothetical protein
VLGPKAKPDRPALEHVKPLLDQARRLLDLALNRKDLSLGQLASRRLSWDPEAQRYNLLPITTEDPDWRLRLRRALVKLLEAEGHRLSRCPAPAPRSDAVCGRLFVVLRPGQAYCSESCQLRVAQQRSRARRTRRRHPLKETS